MELDSVRQARSSEGCCKLRLKQCPCRTRSRDHVSRVATREPWSVHLPDAPTGTRAVSSRMYFPSHRRSGAEGTLYSGRRPWEDSNRLLSTRFKYFTAMFEGIVVVDGQPVVPQGNTGQDRSHT